MKRARVQRVFHSHPQANKHASHKRIRDAPRGGFFQDFTPLCFCFTLQPWNWNSVNMNKELHSVYWTPIHLYKTHPADSRFVTVCVCFQVSSVFHENGSDWIQSDLFLHKHIIGQEQFVCLKKGTVRRSCGFDGETAPNLRCVSESTSVFTAIWSSISYRNTRVQVFSLSRSLIPGERNSTPNVPGEREQSRREINLTHTTSTSTLKLTHKQSLKNT